MKRSLSRLRLSKPSSFTLVEMLVVIGIIAILASVILYAGGTVLRAAKRAKAANTANQIQTAVLAYYTEYSVYPIPSTATANSDVYYSSGSGDMANWSNIVVALCGNVSASSGTTVTATSVANTRQIAFLTLRSSDVDVNSVPLNPINPYSAPANQYFNIAMDGNYDGLLGNIAPLIGVITNFAYPSMPTTNSIAQGVAVWANCNTSGTTNNNFYVHTY
jgi:prepilin-type N-terminal cleavage/methylation domain-containing protein